MQYANFAGPGNHVGTNGSTQFALLPSGTVLALPLPAAVGQVELTYTSMTPATGTYEISISQCPGDIISSDPTCYFGSTNPAELDLTWGNVAGPAGNSCLPATNDGTWYSNIRYTYSGDCNGNPCGEQLQWNVAQAAPDAG